MKMKEFGPPGGGARPWRPPLGSANVVDINIRRFSWHCFLQRSHFIPVYMIHELQILRKTWKYPIISETTSMAYKGLSYGEPVGPDELADVQEELRRLQTENVRFKAFL